MMKQNYYLIRYFEPVYRNYQLILIFHIMEQQVQFAYLDRKWISLKLIWTNKKHPYKNDS